MTTLPQIDQEIRYAYQPEHRLIVYLAFSLLLHLIWLAMPFAPHSPSAIQHTPLVAHLPAPLPSATAVIPITGLPEKSAAYSALSHRASRVPSVNQSIVPAETALPVTTLPTTPTIDLDAARASARAYASEPRSARRGASITTLPRVITIEAVIARAMEPDRIVESRGPAGGIVTQTRDTRCVTPLVVPHYMQEMTVPTQCASR